MKIKIINLIILLVVIAGTLLAISVLPDTVPVHFNIRGEADRWGSKYELLIMSLCLALMQGFWYISELAFRKQAESPEEKVRVEAQNNLKVLSITFTSVSVLFAVLNGATIYMSFSQLEGNIPAIDIFKIITVAMGISFIVFGNIMPKTKNNPLLGFRLPWTRYNDVTWQKTNRISGIAMVILGVVLTLCGLILKGIVSLVVMLCCNVIFVTVLTVYAYGVYKNEK